MRIFYRLFQIALITVPLLAMRQDKPLRVIFFGDSITQAGIGPTGYITKMTEMLKAKGQAGKYELAGAGIGGNKVYDLYLRLENDVLHKKPDVVVIYIGVNDVWHKQLLHTGTDPDKFVKFYQALIDKIKAADAKVILCTPAVIGEKKNGANEMDAELDKIAQTVANRLERYNLKGRTITLKIKYSSFKQITRNQSLTYPVGDFDTLANTAKQLLAATNMDDVRVRLLGISVSNFGELPAKGKKDEATDQLRLF